MVAFFLAEAEEALCTTRSVDIWMYPLVWHYTGPILQHHMPRRTTTNRETHCYVVENHMKTEIKSERHSLLSSVQYDFAGALHSSRDSRNNYRRVWSAFHHEYFPDLAPCEFHEFGPLKEAALGGKKFHTDELIKEAVHRWYAKEYFSRGIQANL